MLVYVNEMLDNIKKNKFKKKLCMKKLLIMVKKMLEIEEKCWAIINKC